MSALFSAAAEFPTVVFTVLLAAAIVYLVLTVVLGIDIGGDDVDVELDGDGDNSFIGGLLATFGLSGIPIGLSATLVSLAVWVLSIVAMTVFSSVTGVLALIVGIVVLAVALVGGMFIAGILARPLRPLFVAEPPVRRGDLVGRTCTVRTGRVDAAFGQATVVDFEGADHVIQVRCPEENDLSEGDTALVFDVDEDGHFLITPQPSPNGSPAP